MYATIESLREISRCCLGDKPLSSELSHWLGHSLEKFLQHSCTSVDDALGLRFAQGGVPWWREEAIRERDAALRELAERFFGELAHTARARRIRTLSVRYAASAWRFDREGDAMPARHVDTPHEYLWRAFRSGAVMPLGERQLRNIL